MVAAACNSQLVRVGWVRWAEHIWYGLTCIVAENERWVEHVVRRCPAQASDEGLDFGYICVPWFVFGVRAVWSQLDSEGWWYSTPRLRVAYGLESS